MWRDQSKSRGAHDAKGPSIMVRCPRDDDDEVHTPSRWRFKRPPAKKGSSHPLRARCASIAVLRLRGLVQRRARPARVIHCLKNLLDSFGALKSNQREISHGGYRGAVPYSGRTIVPKAMLYATQMRAGD